MASIGTPEWLEACLAAAGGHDLGDGPSLTVQFEVAGSPDGKVRWWATLADGTPTAADTGKADAPDVTVEAKWPDFERVLRGELAADLAFMQGRLKVDGAYETFIFEQRAWLSSEPVGDLVDGIAALTD
ncbi:MAG: SCP2 sterol-binding domain-containing protein [Acidimicrobiales bacterium]